MIYCNGVFEGGGVKGVALAGAACSFLESGYRFTKVAGSSAGAIIAALLASGYSCVELEREMKAFDYEKLKGKDLLDRFGFIGKTISLCRSLGVYNLDYLEEWMSRALSEKGIVTFGDLKTKIGGYGAVELKITVTDLTDNKLLILPDDLPSLGIDPDDFSIAKAVRMSAGIPLYYEPVKIKDTDGRTHYLVDGGVLSNYPIWMFDADESGLNTYGFKFKEDKKEQAQKNLGKLNLMEYIKAVISIMTEAHDMVYHNNAADNKTQTIEICSVIKTGGKPEKINATDFDLSDAAAEALFKNGRRSAEKYLSKLSSKQKT